MIIYKTNKYQEWWLPGFCCFLLAYPKVGTDP